MSVVSVTEKRRRSSFKPPADREHTIEYTVLCTLPQEDPKTVKSHGSIPQEGTACAFDSGAICKSVTAEQDEEQPRVWAVECVFTTEILPGVAVDQGGTQGLGPLSQPPVFRFNTAKVAEARFHDQDGVAYMDAAGTPIDGIEIEKSHFVMTISHNEDSFSVFEESVCLDAVNFVSWLGFPTRSLKYTDVSADEAYEQGIHFWRVTRTFEYNPDGWNPTKRLNYGPVYLDDNGKGERILASDDNGVTHEGKVFLDTDGRRLTKSQVEGQKYTWLSFMDYTEANFAILKLGLQ